MPAEFLLKNDAKWERSVNRDSRDRKTKLGRFITRLRSIPNRMANREASARKPVEYSEVPNSSIAEPAHHRAEYQSGMIPDWQRPDKPAPVSEANGRHAQTEGNPDNSVYAIRDRLIKERYPEPKHAAPETRQNVAPQRVGERQDSHASSNVIDLLPSPSAVIGSEAWHSEQAAQAVQQELDRPRAIGESQSYEGLHRAPEPLHHEEIVVRGSVIGETHAVPDKEFPSLKGDLRDIPKTASQEDDQSQFRRAA